MDFSNRLTFSLAALVCSALALAQSEVPNDPAKTNPLKVGTAVPNVKIRNIEGKELTLKDALGGKPTVLIFYRGSWCPYCNKHLSELMTIEQDLIKSGFQIYAVSPDKPEGLKAVAEKNKLDYTLFSDSKAEVAKAFGLAFVVDEQTRERYKGFGIDLNTASGESHNILPVPAVYIIGKDGKVAYAYSNPDYRVRLKAEDVLKAAKAVSD